MQKGEGSGQELEIIERRRRSQSKYNKDLPRYECFCSKQYLSYPALYLHMKNKHIDYFQSSKNGRVEPTKLIESFNPAQGYKVYKIAVDSVQKEIYSNKYLQQNYIDSAKSNYYMNQNSNFMFPNMSFPQNCNYFMPGTNEEQKKNMQRNAVIEVALSMYLQTLKERPFKNRSEVQLFFILLVDCLNKNYEILKDVRTESKEVRRYTAEYNSEKILGIVPFFQSVYLPSAAQQSKMTSFFVKNSHIISSGEYKAVLNEFMEYVYDKRTKPAINLPPPQSPFFDAEVGSEEGSRNEQGEEDYDDEDQNDEEVADES